MSLFKRKKDTPIANLAGTPAGAISNYSALAELTLDAITDGVLLVDERGLIKFANPAAAEMVGYGTPNNMLGLSFESVLKLENSEGMAIPPEQNKLVQYFMANQPLTIREYTLVSIQAERRSAISLSLTPTGGPESNKIITFRDITKELEDEEKQSEFISTASHEMRTPVASIEGYLGLALNPQTATIDDRARQYLDAAHKSSQHLGRLFRDLLDVTKLDDGRIKLHPVPVEIISTVREMAGSREKDMQAKHIKYGFGVAGASKNDHQIDQLVYASVDLDFLREILDNLIDNAIKYTPDGGEIWVNARGDGDKILINVSDSGIGISPEDAGHIFQKFYRVDNSQTRQIGGTGLGLYLVKQRVEAMGGRVWVESNFGNGSTFFVSLPRLSATEYERRRIAYENAQAAQNARSAQVTQNIQNTQNIPMQNVQMQGAKIIGHVANVSAAAPVQTIVGNPATQVPATNPAIQAAPAEAVPSGQVTEVNAIRSSQAPNNVSTRPQEVLQVRNGGTGVTVKNDANTDTGQSVNPRLKTNAGPSPNSSPPAPVAQAPSINRQPNPAVAAAPVESVSLSNQS